MNKLKENYATTNSITFSAIILIVYTKYIFYEKVLINNSKSQDVINLLKDLYYFKKYYFMNTAINPGPVFPNGTKGDEKFKN